MGATEMHVCATGWNLENSVQVTTLEQLMGSTSSGGTTASILSFKDIRLPDSNSALCVGAIVSRCPVLSLSRGSRDSSGSFQS
jgi:hypothetical protein